MLIYLDMCCFNRPFDDQAHTRPPANPDRERTKAIAEWRMFATHDLSVTEQVEALADTLQTIGIKSMDALHLACAISAGATYFLTTDKGILRKMTQDQRIRVLDPIAFLSEYRGTDDENGS